MERSRECNVFARGFRLSAVIAVNALSAKLKCRRNRHFDVGKLSTESRLELLFLGLYQESDKLDRELPEPERLTLCGILPFVV